jgi:hypothetical protein
MFQIYFLVWRVETLKLSIGYKNCNADYSIEKVRGGVGMTPSSSYNTLPARLTHSFSKVSMVLGVMALLKSISSSVLIKKAMCRMA